uniref:Uncharacterized protein n=1 Tax=Aegilops tauschii subsp. strangulata TaxID=200361 RepID=A0A453KC81_AEGTS
LRELVPSVLLNGPSRKARTRATRKRTSPAGKVRRAHRPTLLRGGNAESRLNWRRKLKKQARRPRCPGEVRGWPKPRRQRLQMLHSRPGPQREGRNDGSL